MAIIDRYDVTNMRLTPIVVMASLFIATTLLPSPTQAADSIQDRRSSASGVVRENGGFLELGIVGEVSRDAFTSQLAEDSGEFELKADVNFGGYLQYRSLFIEATDSWFGGVNFGVNLLDSEHWSVDVLLANISGEFSTWDDNDRPIEDYEFLRNREILERSTLYIAAGTRINSYFGDNILQLQFVSDWYKGNGLLGSARFGRQWLLGNWNIQGIVGVRYHSSEFNNYLYGVSEEEATTRFSAYQADSAWVPEVELGVSYPVDQNWVISSRLRYRALPDSVSNSPIVSHDNEMFWSNGLHYVF